MPTVFDTVTLHSGSIANGAVSDVIPVSDVNHVTVAVKPTTMTTATLDLTGQHSDSQASDAVWFDYPAIAGDGIGVTFPQSTATTDRKSQEFKARGKYFRVKFTTTGTVAADVYAWPKVN